MEATGGPPAARQSFCSAEIGCKLYVHDNHPTPYTPHPTLYTLHPTPYTLHPIPYTHTLHPTPYTLHSALYTLYPTPYTLHPTPYTLLSTLVSVDSAREG